MSTNVLELQKNGVHQFVAPAAIYDDAAATAIALDMAGKDAITIYFNLGVTDIAAAVMSVQESDTLSGTALASAANVFVFGTTQSSVIPSATDDGDTFAVTLDWNGDRKRYVSIAFTAGNGTAGTYFSAMGVWRAKEVPTTNTVRGTNQHYVV